MSELNKLTLWYTVDRGKTTFCRLLTVFKGVKVRCCFLTDKILAVDTCHKQILFYSYDVSGKKKTSLKALLPHGDINLSVLVNVVNYVVACAAA